jgi:glucosyl-dolichyl phosphate glucuronosyltransferase
VAADSGFSVVIPTFRRPEALRETLMTILRCDPAPAEIIVVDGDPGGSARPVVDELLRSHRAPRFVYLQEDANSTVQRNRGIDVARSDLLLFLDDDVAVEADVLGRLRAAFDDPTVVATTGHVVEEAGRRLVGASSGLRRFLPGGGREGTFTRFGYPRYVVHADHARDVEFMQGCFMSARRAAAARVRFDERLTGYALAEDEDFSLRLSRLGRVRYLPEVTVRHHKLGFRTIDRRALSRLLVRNRAYLFRKNFPQTPVARAQFVLLLALLVAHRAVNRDWAGVRGTLEGVIAAWRERREPPRPSPSSPPTRSVEDPSATSSS